MVPENNSFFFDGNQPCSKHDFWGIVQESGSESKPYMLRGWPGTSEVAHHRSPGEKFHVACGNMKKGMTTQGRRPLEPLGTRGDSHGSSGPLWDRVQSV